MHMTGDEHEGRVDGGEIESASAEWSDFRPESVFHRGVLEIPYLPPPLLQRLLPVSFFALIGVWIALVAYALTAGMRSFWWPSAQGSPVVGMFRMAMGVMAVWLVVHAFLVCHQRWKALERAKLRAPPGASPEALARLCSLCFSYAGYQHRGFWWVWPHLEYLRREITGRKMAAGEWDSVPRVWIVDAAPALGLVEFAEADTAVCAHPVRVGHSEAWLTIVAWLLVLGGAIIAMAPRWWPALPWKSGRMAVYVGGGIGALILLVVIYRRLSRAPRLSQINGNACLLTPNTAGSVPEYLRGLSVATYILTPVYSQGATFRKRHASLANLYVLGLGTPRIELEIDADSIKYPNEP